jgi:hypothetical protein
LEADNRVSSRNTQPAFAENHQMPPERSSHQEKIIKNYYRNRDAIGLQKAQEAITELYLSEGKKRATVWKRLASHLEKVGLPADQIEHLREQDDPEMVANILKKFV